MGCSYLIGNRIRVNDKRMLAGLLCCSKNLVSKIFSMQLVCCAYAFQHFFSAPLLKYDKSSSLAQKSARCPFVVDFLVKTSIENYAKQQQGC